MAAAEGSARGNEDVVQLERAVEMLLEHLVVPVLPLRGHLDLLEALSPETQDAVARQVHATVLLYNYYHRKQFPELEFATPSRFTMAASQAVSNKNLLLYINGTPDGGPSVTDKAIVDACGIAAALEPRRGDPDMTMWPISTVAVLLLHKTKKTCLLQRGSQTQGVWSIFEKDITTSTACSLRSADTPVQQLQQPSRNTSITTLASEPTSLASRPHMLQQIAYSEVELKTGIRRTNLQFIEEHLVYSLNKKGTTTVLFLLHYDVMVDRKLMEIPLGDLVQRMTGPIFESGGHPTTTSVVQYYHLLPYKEVLLNVLNRDWPLGSSLSTPNEQVVKAVGDSSTNNCCGSKNKKVINTNYCKRKLEAFNAKVATSAEHGADLSPTRNLPASVQMDKNRIEKNESRRRNVPQDIIPIPDDDPVINDHAMKIEKEKVTNMSSDITHNLNVQKYATLQLLQKMRDDTLREHIVLGDQCAEYEMDIQTILTETEMTPKVTSILKEYENSWKMMEVANPCQTINLKQKKLKEAIRLRNRVQELDYLCRDSNWNLPRYMVLPSVTGDMYQASVDLRGPDFNLSVDGDVKVTPLEARDSAASIMLSQLQQKAMED